MAFILWTLSAALAPAAPLEAVGRISLDGQPNCTGALIAPDLVLTAAHCLYDPATGRAVDPARLSFGAGWQGQDHRAYRMVSRAVAHPGYRYDQGSDADRLRRDLAVLRLSHAIPRGTVETLGFADRPAIGESLRVATFQPGQAVLPQSCRALGRQVGVLVTSCTVDFGHSGAPILRMAGGRAQIVSVIAAKGRSDGRDIALGAALQDEIALLLDHLDKTP